MVGYATPVRAALFAALASSLVACQFDGTAATSDAGSSDGADASTPPDAPPDEVAPDANELGCDDPGARLMFTATDNEVLTLNSVRVAGSTICEQETLPVAPGAKSAWWLEYRIGAGGGEAVVVAGEAEETPGITSEGLAVYVRPSGGSWAAPTTMEASVDPQHRTFDVEYDASGELFLVFVAADGQLFFTRMGNALPVPNSPLGIRWVELLPRPGSDDIALAYATDDQDFTVTVWDGDDWGMPTVVENELSTVNQRAFDLAYAQSGDLVAAWGNGNALHYGPIGQAPAEMIAVGSEIDFVDLASSGGAIAGCAADTDSNYEADDFEYIVGFQWPSAAAPAVFGVRFSASPSPTNMPVAATRAGADTACIFPNDEAAPFGQDTTLDWVRSSDWDTTRPTANAGGTGAIVSVQTVTTASGETFAVFSEGRELYAVRYDDALATWTHLGPPTALTDALSSSSSRCFGIAAAIP